MKQLNEASLSHFDAENVSDLMWAVFLERVRGAHSSGQFRFIDLGGGTGRFADQVLAAFPGSHGVVLDNAATLLDRNTEHPRKRLLLSGIEDAPLAAVGSFDIVCFNWSLHHLVMDGYAATRRAVDGALLAARDALLPGGHVSVFENLYDGAVAKGLPGRLIFAITSSRALTPVARLGGANTAGVGVCFRSRSGWLDVFDANGLTVEATAEDPPWRMPLKRKVFLHTGHVRPGHFWLAPNRAESRAP